jgi:hypothetical protein
LGHSWRAPRQRGTVHAARQIDVGEKNIDRLHRKVSCRVVRIGHRLDGSPALSVLARPIH